jgi:hypothetical protein
MSGPPRNANEEGSADFRPLLQLGQPVRRHDGSEIGVVIGIILGAAERALVRWVDGSRLEPVENLIEVNKLSSSALDEQPDVAWLIRAKVVIGQLPRRTNTKYWVGFGTGQSCAGCDKPIVATDVEHEVDVIGLGTLRFHRACMRFWEEASALRHDIAGGSEPCRVVFPRSSWTAERMASGALRNGNTGSALTSHARPPRPAVVTTLARAPSRQACSAAGSRLHRAGRLMAVRGRRRHTAIYAAVVSVALVVSYGLGLTIRWISSAPDGASARLIAWPRHESSSTVAASPPSGEGSASRQLPPRRAPRNTPRRPGNAVTAGSSSASLSTVSRAPLPAVVADTSPLRTDQAP